MPLSRASRLRSHHSPAPIIVPAVPLRSPPVPVPCFCPARNAKHGGVARGAKLAIFDVAATDSYLSDYAGNDLWRVSEDTGARIHSNSWGALTGCVSQPSAAIYDEYMYEVRASGAWPGPSCCFAVDEVASDHPRSLGIASFEAEALACGIPCLHAAAPTAASTAGATALIVQLWGKTRTNHLSASPLFAHLSVALPPPPHQRRADRDINAKININTGVVGYITSQNPEHLLIFAAGNSGNLSNNPSYGSCSIGSPAIAKNVLAVGATSSGPTRQTSTSSDGGYEDPTGPATTDPADIDTVAWFSSRGPTLDGRVKPEVVAPGDQVSPARSAHVDLVSRAPALSFAEECARVLHG